MITEQYVTFETAKMLKKAGFDIPCERMFLKDGCPGITAEKENHNDITCNAYSRPTQQLAARWLREVHHYAVCIWFTKDHEKWFYAYGNMDKIVFDTDYNISEYKYDSYEAALEEGLQECLKLIIKRNMGEKSLRLGLLF